MRCRRVRGAITALGAAVALGAGIAVAASSCTPVLCGRNSDCPLDQVCSATSTCMTPPPPTADGGAGDGGAGSATDDSAPSIPAIDGDAATVDGGP